MKRISISLTFILFATVFASAQQTTYRADKIIAKKHFQIGDYVIEGFTIGDYADFLDTNKVPTSKAVRSFINRRLDTSRGIPSALVTHWQLDSTVAAGGDAIIPSNVWRTDTINAANSKLRVGGSSFIAEINGLRSLEINDFNSSYRKLSTILGYANNSQGNAGLSFGAYSSSADSCISIGYAVLAAGTNSISIGNRVISSHDYSIAIGNDIYSPFDNTGTDYILDSTLYISRYIKHFHLQLDSSAGIPLNMIGVGNDGYWYKYALPSTGGGDLQSTLTTGHEANIPILIKGPGNIISVQDTTSFSEAGMSADGTIWASNSAGKYVQVKSDSLTVPITLYWPQQPGMLAIKADIDTYADTLATLRNRIDSLESVLLPLDSLDTDESLTRSKLGNITTLGVNPAMYYDRSTADAMNDINYSSIVPVGDTGVVFVKNSGARDTIFFPTKGYKEYMAILNQSGTNDPSVGDIIKNDIGNIVWTRIGNGEYEGTCTGCFGAGKTITIFQTGIIADGKPFSSSFYRLNNDTVKLFTSDDGSGADDNILKSSVIIQVYN